MKTEASSHLLGISLCVIFWSAALGLRVGALDELAKARVSDQGDVLASPGPAAMKVVSIEHHYAWADLFWLGIVQDFGRLVEGEQPNFDRMVRWAHIATDLDELYYTIYYATSINLSVYAPNGAVESDRLLQKGRIYLPGQWQFPFMIGYNAYFIHADAIRAARYWELASNLPDRPRFLPSLAARARYHGGDTIGAEQMLLDMIDYLDGPAREDAEWRLKALRSEPILSQYDDACQRFRTERGRLPADGAELHREGFVTAPPVDLFESPISLDDKCRARTDQITTREDEARQRVGGELKDDAVKPDDLVDVVEPAETP